ncbi:PqqD family protein [Labilibacter sediminis]|nr:PqqD family protein [Labilibacter sediminis]
MDFSVVYHKSKSFVEKSIGDEKVLVPLSDNVADMNHVFTLNDVAAFIFEQVDGVRSVTDIFNLLLEEYNVSAEIVKKDIELFITDSVNRGVLFTKQ